MNTQQQNFITRTADSVCRLFAVPEAIAVFIACQSALETFYGTSNVCLQNSNLFGMKMPRTRISTSRGVLNSHAVYLDYQSSLVDYMLYLQSQRFSQSDFYTLSSFIEKLSKTKYNPNMSDYLASICDVYNSYYDACGSTNPNLHRLYYVPEMR